MDAGSEYAGPSLGRRRFSRDSFRDTDNAFRVDGGGTRASWRSDRVAIPR